MLNSNKHTDQSTYFSMRFQVSWFNGLHSIRQWLNGLEICNDAFARLICRLIPAQCPFERDIYLLGRKVGYIPPLCKFNPFYEELVSLRFRALCYLADRYDDVCQV